MKRQAHTVDHEISLSEGELSNSVEPLRAKIPSRQIRPSYTVVVAPSDSEEEDTMEFAIQEQAIDNLLGDDSEPEKEQAQINPYWIDEFTEQLVGEEETGLAVAENLANIVGKMLKIRQTEDRTKALL